MMQMSETHAERRRVRSTFHRGWGDATVQLTPESTKRLRVSEYLMALGRHRFVISPRGNGLDAHRTWETLLVGSIPSMRRTYMHLHLHLHLRVQMYECIYICPCACKCTNARTCTCTCTCTHAHITRIYTLPVPSILHLGGPPSASPPLGRATRRVPSPMLD